MHISRLSALTLAAALIPAAAQAAQTTFEQASALLQSARAGNNEAVRVMIQSGVDVNYKDPSGLTLVCTAIMNNDLKTANVLQSYGADASLCDAQIREYRRNNEEVSDVGIFSGLTSTQSTLLVGGGAALGIGALAYLSGLYSSSNDNSASDSSGERGDGSGGGTTEPTETITLPAAPNPEYSLTDYFGEFDLLSMDARLTAALPLTRSYDMPYVGTNPNFYRTNYLLVSSAYDANMRGYLGQTTIRGPEGRLINISGAGSLQGIAASGGKPINVALISGNGITRSGSIADTETQSGGDLPKLVWAECTGNCGTSNPTLRATEANKFANITIARDENGVPTFTENKNYNLQNNASSVFNTTLGQQVFTDAFATNWDVLEFGKYNKTASYANFETTYGATNQAALEYLKYNNGATYQTFLAYQLLENGLSLPAGCGNKIDHALSGSGGLTADCNITEQFLDAGNLATANFLWKSYKNTATFSDFAATYTKLYTDSATAQQLVDLGTGAALTSATNIDTTTTTFSAMVNVIFRVHSGTASFNDFAFYYNYMSSNPQTFTPETETCDATENTADCPLSGDALAAARAAWKQYKLKQTAYLDDSLLAKILVGDMIEDDFPGYIPNGQLTIIKTGNGRDENGRPTDLLNFQAMIAAKAAPGVSIIANADATKFSVLSSTDTADSLAALGTDASGRTAFQNKVNQFYRVKESDFINAGLTATDWGDYLAANPNAPGYFAEQLFNAYPQDGNGMPMIIFGAGDYLAASSPSTTLTATFENIAPKIYPNLEHLFMTSVAVMAMGGTDGVSITQSNPAASNSSNKIVLSQYADFNTGDIFRARSCGRVAGRGTDTIDPWCFAAPGINSEQSVASLAGSVGIVNGAFNYMSMRQLFTLLAVTADRLALTEDELKAKYELPSEYNARIALGENYKDVFAEVFGFGLTNLNRATTPNSKVVVFTRSGNTDKIISSSGNSTWQARAAALGGQMIDAKTLAGTNIIAGRAFGGKLNGISARAADMVVSADGDMSMPRIWDIDANAMQARNSLDLFDNLRNFGNENITTTYDRDGIKLGFAQGLDMNDEIYMREISLELDGDKTFARLGYSASDSGFANDVAFSGRGAVGIMGLASNNVQTLAGRKFGKFRLGVGGFSGSIKISDDIIADTTNSAKNPTLGKMYGFNFAAKFAGEKSNMEFTAGSAIETNTILGAFGSGLMDLGGSSSLFARGVAGFDITDGVRLNASAEIVETSPANSQNFVMSDMSKFVSTAAAAELEIGKFTFGAALPLAIQNGYVKYLDVDMDYAETDNGYDLMINTADRKIDLAQDNREVRLNAAYRFDIGDWTTANIGAIYRMNPDNMTNGDESILMLKLRHRLGI